MVAENLDGIDEDDHKSTYLVLGYNDGGSSRIDFRSSDPEDYDVQHQVACIRCDSKFVLDKLLENFRGLSEYSTASISRFVRIIPDITVQVEGRFDTFHSAFRNQYQVVWQRTSTVEEA